jgi:hypothetical protein
MRPLLAGIFLFVFGLGAGGCCGIGLPSEDQARRSLSTITPGIPADQAFKVLEAKGYEPAYHDIMGGHGIRGAKRSECLFVTDLLSVYVELDQQDRVVSLNVWRARIPM